MPFGSGFWIEVFMVFFAFYLVRIFVVGAGGSTLSEFLFWEKISSLTVR